MIVLSMVFSVSVFTVLIVLRVFCVTGAQATILSHRPSWLAVSGSPPATPRSWMGVRFLSRSLWSTSRFLFCIVPPFTGVSFPPPPRRCEYQPAHSARAELAAYLVVALPLPWPSRQLDRLTVRCVACGPVPRFLPRRKLDRGDQTLGGDDPLQRRQPVLVVAGAVV